MTNLKLSLGCWDYDRVQSLIDGRVRPTGIDLTFLNMIVEETFFRMLRNHEFDVCEMSMSSYVVSRFKPDRPFVAIPVFPSRFFRHSCIYVNADAGIEKPADLIGKRIGTPEYQMTAPVWIRGILSEHYQVPVDSVTYVTGGEESPNRDEKLKLDLPANIKVERISAGNTLAQMLLSGEIDALHTARKPSTFDGVRVKRLFPDFMPVEKSYYAETGIFPIMHVIAIRRAIMKPMAPPMAMAMPISTILAMSCVTSVVAIAISMPKMPKRLPVRLVEGLERPRSARMKNTPATR